MVVVAVNTSLLEMQTYTEMEDCFWCWSLNHPFQVSSRHVANVRSAMFSAEGGHAAQAGPRHQDGERDEGGERARLLRGQAALRTLFSQYLYFIPTYLSPSVENAASCKCGPGLDPCDPRRR